MHMSMFVSLTINGLAMGMVYALLAMGLVLLVRAVGSLNFAQGDFLMMGAYVSFGYIYMLKMPEIIGVILSVITYAAIGAAFMVSFYWPVRKAKWSQAIMVCTLAASMIFKDAANLIFGTTTKAPSAIMPGSLKIAGLSLQYQYLIIIGVCFFVILGVFTLFEKLYFGRMMEAASQNKYAAELIGIPTILTMAATYMISMTIAGIGGYLVAPIFLVETTLTKLQLGAFAGVVVGGFGSLKGAIYGCILIGLIESYSTYVTTTYKDLVVFGALLLTLVIRPQGFFGESIAEKA